MRLSPQLPFLIMKLVLTFAFCQQALGYDIGVSAFLSVLALHPLTLSIPALLSLHALVNVPSAEHAAMILLPMGLLAALIWIARDDAPTKPGVRVQPVRRSIPSAT